MPRNMSFALTTKQFKSRTKTVTRRKGWKFLKVGDVVMGCVKCMGMKPGEKLQRLGLIKITDVRREQLYDIHSEGDDACAAEGFPDISTFDFVDMFCQHMGGIPNQFITRIEFEYIDHMAEWPEDLRVQQVPNMGASHDTIKKLAESVETIDDRIKEIEKAKHVSAETMRLEFKDRR